MNLLDITHLVSKRKRGNFEISYLFFIYNYFLYFQKRIKRQKAPLVTRTFGALLYEKRSVQCNRSNLRHIPNCSEGVLRESAYPGERVILFRRVYEVLKALVAIPAHRSQAEMTFVVENVEQILELAICVERVSELILLLVLLIRILSCHRDVLLK